MNQAFDVYSSHDTDTLLGTLVFVDSSASEFEPNVAGPDLFDLSCATGETLEEVMARYRYYIFVPKETS